MDKVFPGSLLIYKVFRVRRNQQDDTACQFDKDTIARLGDEISCGVTAAIRSIVNGNRQDRICLDSGNTGGPNLLFYTEVAHKLKLNGHATEEEIISLAFEGFKLHIAEEERRQGRPIRIDAEHAIRVDSLNHLLIERHGIAEVPGTFRHAA